MLLLITGITGHSGRYFLQELTRNKYEGTIRCVVRKSSDTSLLDSSGLNIEKVIGDLDDQEFMDEAMEGIDTIMHICGDYILSGEKPIAMFEMLKLISDNLGKKTTFVSVPLGLGVFMAACLKVCTLGKVDYTEKVQRMGEDRSFPHDAARRDFGYDPMPFEEGIKIEVKQYVEKFKG